MKSVVQYFVLSLCVALFDAKASNDDRHVFRCDYKYFPDADGWMKLHEIPSNWPEAHLTCYLEGGILASPITSEIRQAMMKLKSDIINTTSSVANTPISVHTGINAMYVKTSFASIEGVPLSQIQHKWAPGSPYSDVVRDASSLVMGPDGSLSGVDGLETQLPYICYKQYEKMRINECGTVDDDYYLEQKTGSCYKFHHVARTWLDAYMTCSLEGGHLVVVNSNDEAHVVADLIAKNTNTDSKEDKHKKSARNDADMYTESGEYESLNLEFAQDAVVHIGYTRSKAARWLPMTIHGQTLQEAGYSKIGKKFQGYLCGAMDDKAYLVTTSCNHMYYRFVCEKDPKSTPCGGE